MPRKNQKKKDKDDLEKLIVKEKRIRIKKQPKFIPLQPQSKISKLRKKYELESLEHSNFQKGLIGFEKSSACMKLYDLFCMYNQRFH